jgi:predicted lipoprotein with Yx(FWY)xxD motif
MLRPALRSTAILFATLLVAACSSSGGGSTASASAPAASSAAPSSAAPSSAAPSASGSAAAGGDYEIKTATGGPGPFLTGEGGKTLYLVKKDTQGNGKSVCNGDCLKSWPAFTVDAGENATAGTGVTASKISTITRDDGTTQIAYDGWPLYYFAADTKAGDTNGQGVGSVWFVANP